LIDFPQMGRRSLQVLRQATVMGRDMAQLGRDFLSRGLFVVSALLLITDAAFGVTAEPVEFMYAGTWTNLPAAGFQPTYSGGIYGWRVSIRSGRFEPLGLVAPAIMPDSLAASPDGRFLYATRTNFCVCLMGLPFPGAPRAQVSAYSIDSRSGALTFLNSVDAAGDVPADIKVSPSGRALVIGHFYSGNLVSYRILPDGRLGGLLDQFQHSGPSVGHFPVGPHVHGLTFSHDGRRLYAADLGIDRLFTYRVDPSTDRLTAANPPYLQVTPGKGPRHIAVHPNDRWIYVNNETIGVATFLERREDGLHSIQDLPLVAETSDVPVGAAECKVSPDGRFLYANSRTYASIAVYALDSQTGRMTHVQYAASAAQPDASRAEWPLPVWMSRTESGARIFDWDHSSTWLASANLGENAIVIMRRDPHSGTLQRTGQVLPVPQPSFVLFVRPGATP
jgi:6-phosphogluconolactonase